MAPKKVTKHDPTLPFTPVTIDGTAYRLCYDFEAIGQIEAELEAAGHRDINLLVSSWTINARTLPTLFAAGVRTYHPELGFEDAKRLVNFRNAMELTVAIRKAQGQFVGDQEKADETPNPPEAPAQS